MTCLKVAIAQGKGLARVIGHDDLEPFGSSKTIAIIPTYEHHHCGLHRRGFGRVTVLPVFGNAQWQASQHRQTKLPDDLQGNVLEDLPDFDLPRP